MPNYVTVNVTFSIHVFISWKTRNRFRRGKKRKTAAELRAIVLIIIRDLVFPSRNSYQDRGTERIADSFEKQRGDSAV